LPEKQTTPKRPRENPPSDCPVISEYTDLKKLLFVGREKEVYRNTG
jgi:hypothetical protein